MRLPLWTAWRQGSPRDRPAIASGSSLPENTSVSDPLTPSMSSGPTNPGSTSVRSGSPSATPLAVVTFRSPSSDPRSPITRALVIACSLRFQWISLPASPLSTKRDATTVAGTLAFQGRVLRVHFDWNAPPVCDAATVVG